MITGILLFLVIVFNAAALAGTVHHAVGEPLQGGAVVSFVVLDTTLFTFSPGSRSSALGLKVMGMRWKLLFLS